MDSDVTMGWGLTEFPRVAPRSIVGVFSEILATDLSFPERVYL